MRRLALAVPVALAGCIPVPNAAPVPLPAVPLLLLDPAVRHPEPRESRTYDVSSLSRGDDQAAVDLARRLRFVLPDAAGYVVVRGADELLVHASARSHARVEAWLASERASR